MQAKKNAADFSARVRHALESAALPGQPAVGPTDVGRRIVLLHLRIATTVPARELLAGPRKDNDLQK
jgi:hypothetical protein